MQREMQAVESIQEEELQSSLTDTVPCFPTHSASEKRIHSNPVVKCPRCDSSNTKFCYYNNYSLTQPRYFCKGCRRYWTEGGALRNVPMGGGCRRNKRSKHPSTKQRIGPPQGGGGGGCVGSSSNKTSSGDSSTATSAPRCGTGDDSNSSALFPQNVIGSCVTSGYVKYLGNGKGPARLLLDAIYTTGNDCPNSTMYFTGSSSIVGNQEEKERVKNPSLGALNTSKSRQPIFSDNSLISNKQDFCNFPIYVPGNSIPQLNRLAYLDPTLLPVNFLNASMQQEQKPIHNDHHLPQIFGSQFSSVCNVTPISHTESIVVSSVRTDPIDLSNSGLDWRLKNHDHQTVPQQEQKFDVMPTNQLLLSSTHERARGNMIDPSAVSFDKTRENFPVADSQRLCYGNDNVAFDWQLDSDGFSVNPSTTELCYVGDEEVWLDFPLFGTGSGTLI